MIIPRYLMLQQIASSAFVIKSTLSVTTAHLSVRSLLFGLCCGCFTELSSSPVM